MNRKTLSGNRLTTQIERSREVNAAMFDAISKAVKASNVESAANYLRERFDNSGLYWFYVGGSHVAVQSKHHQQRIAIIRA